MSEKKTDREVMKMVMVAPEKNAWACPRGSELEAAYIELREALAAPAQEEPFTPDWANYRQGFFDGRDAEREALAAPQPAQSLALQAALRYVERNTPALVHSEIAKALAAPQPATERAKELLDAFAGAPFVQAQGCLSGVSAPQPGKRLTGLVLSEHRDPMNGASIPDPFRFGVSAPQPAQSDEISRLNQMLDNAAAEIARLRAENAEKDEAAPQPAQTKTPESGGITPDWEQEPAGACVTCGALGHDQIIRQPVQEPVAWIEHEWSGTGLRHLHFEKREPTVRDEVVNPVWTPLYATPQPQRQPLTRNRVKEIMTDAGYEGASANERATFINGLRHGELAHGIGDKQ